MIEPGRGTFLPEIDCNVNQIAYGYDTRTLLLLLPVGAAADMAGAIMLFERIDPAVQSIHACTLTNEGRTVTVMYDRQVSGEWQVTLGEDATAPACNICGGGELWGGFPVWKLSDPKIAEHATHDTALVWDREAHAWIERHTPRAQAILRRHVMRAEQKV